MESRSARVTNVPVKSIAPNPHNPRRLFDPQPLKVLKESIEKLGILVPLDVYPKDAKGTDPTQDSFVLLDGERRWRCAQELGVKEVPCLIVESPTTEQNILTMFHIHNVREGWQLMPTALKLKELMKILETENERELAELTKLTLSQVRRCKILLTYPKKFQNMMLTPVSDRFKADFFIDLHRIRRPALEEKFPPWISRGDSKCIQIMIDKYVEGTIRAVTEFRLLAAVYRASEQHNKLDEFMRELDTFLSKSEMRIEDIDVPGASYALEIREIGRSTRRLLGQLKALDLENISSDEGLIGDLRLLAQMIDNKLQEALLNVPRELQEK